MNADIQYSFIQTYILITHVQNPVLYVIAVLCHLWYGDAVMQLFTHNGK